LVSDLVLATGTVSARTEGRLSLSRAQEPGDPDAGPGRRGSDRSGARPGGYRRGTGTYARTCGGGTPSTQLCR